MLLVCLYGSGSHRAWALRKRPRPQRKLRTSRDIATTKVADHRMQLADARNLARTRKHNKGFFLRKLPRICGYLVGGGWFIFPSHLGLWAVAATEVVVRKGLLERSIWTTAMGDLEILFWPVDFAQKPARQGKQEK